MGLSINKTPYTGGAQTFAVNFALDFLNREDVTVYVEGELDGLGDIIYRDFVWIDDGNVTVTDAITLNDVVVVQRTVSKESLVVDFTNEGSATRQNIQFGLQQAMMAMHEFIDGRIEPLETVYPFSSYITQITQLYQDNLQTVVDATNEKDLAEAAKVLAEAAATEANANAVAAMNSEVAAGTSETNAEASATDAAASLASIGASETNAANSATAAAASVASIGTSVSNAAASAAAASTSETNAANSETNAGTQAANSATSATASSNSAVAASASETNAGTSATASETSSVNSASSASTSTTQAGLSSSSASAAAGSATAADTSATNAGISETNAATSAGSASTSATNASTSETNAATSATNSETSAVASAASAAAAAAVASTTTIIPSYSVGTALTVDVAVKSLITSFHTPTYTDILTMVGGAKYRRATRTDILAHPSALSFRTIDRFDPDGTTGTGFEGGWWLIDEPDLTPYMFGVAIGEECATEINHILNVQGFINLPEGTFFVGTNINVTHKDRVNGAGKFRTTIKAENNMNSHLITGANTWSVVGTASYDLNDGSNEVEITNITLDGNKDNQTAGNGIFIWGYGLSFRSVIVQNVKHHGIHTEFSDAAVAMEASYDDVLIVNCGRDGWRNRGPHDFHGANIRIIDSSQEADSAYYGMRIENSGAASRSNGRLFNCHIWHKSTATNRNKAAIYSGGGVEAVACHFEGCRTQVVHAGSDDRFLGCYFYAPFGASGNALVDILGNDNQHIGCNYRLTSDVENTSGTTINGSTYAIYFEGSGNTISAGKFNGFHLLSPFEFDAGSAINKIEGVGYCSPGGATAFGGTLQNNNQIIYAQGGSVINFYRPQIIPGPYAGSTEATAAGVQPLSWYRDNNGIVFVLP